MKLGGAFRLIFGSGVEAIGGGDSVSAINQAGVADQITRISTLRASPPAAAQPGVSGRQKTA